MAKYFESLVRNDPFFEIPAKRHLGLVVFRLKVMSSSEAMSDVIRDRFARWKLLMLGFGECLQGMWHRLRFSLSFIQGPNCLTESVLKEIAKAGRIFLIPATVQDKLIIRFTVTSQFTTRDDILRDWNLIRDAATLVLSQHCTSQPSPQARGLIPQTRGPRALSTGVALQSFGGAEDDLAQARRIVKQPQRVGAGLVGREDGRPLETLLDPPDDCFSEETPAVAKRKLSSFLINYLSVRNKKKAVRSQLQQCACECSEATDLRGPREGWRLLRGQHLLQVS